MLHSKYWLWMFQSYPVCVDILKSYNYYLFMCQKIDSIFFERLTALDPIDVCKRSLVQYDEKKRIYKVTAFGEEYSVKPEEQKIIPLNPESKLLTTELGLLIIFYLLGAQDIPLSGKWVNEFSLRGGALFFRGPHAIRNQALAGRYGYDINEFKQACTKLCGQSVQMGDVAYRFQILPRIPVLVVLWFGDEEFEPAAKLLMDATLDQHLPLDVIYAMATEFIRLLMSDFDQ